jgi:hypothetical protein
MRLLLVPDVAPEEEEVFNLISPESPVWVRVVLQLEPGARGVKWLLLLKDIFSKKRVAG